MVNDDGLTACEPCNIGTYQPNQGQTVCILCPEGFATECEGARTIHSCKGIIKKLNDLHTFSDKMQEFVWGNISFVH